MSKSQLCEFQYNMSNTFVKLPTGDIEIEHILQLCIDLSFTRFELMPWKPRPALIDKSGQKWLYTGQKYDRKYIQLIEDGWTHDHCEICFTVLGNKENQATFSSGYFNGGVWVCESCYKNLIAVDNLEKKLAELPQYQK
jgi:hypothetical protein